MNHLHRGSIALLAGLLLLQLSTCSAGPVRSNRMTRVLPRSFGNIQRVVRNDANVGEKYLQTKIADPVAATTLEPLAPTTEGFSPVFDQETFQLSTNIQDDISPAVLTESDLIDEPAVLLSVLDVDYSSVVDDTPLLIDFQDVVEHVPTVEEEEEIAPEVEKHSDDHLPVEEVPAIAPDVEDHPVDLRIVAEPVIVAIPTAAAEVPVFVHSELVDVPLVDAPVSVTSVSPAVPIFIASVLPLEPVESPEAVPEKVESEAPIYSPLDLPVLDPLPPASYPSNPVRSELSSHFPNRPFGILPKARELGFPPVSNTRENVLRDVNWNAKVGRAYRSS